MDSNSLKMWCVLKCTETREGKSTSKWKFLFSNCPKGIDISPIQLRQFLSTESILISTPVVSTIEIQPFVR